MVGVHQDADPWAKPPELQEPYLAVSCVLFPYCWGSECAAGWGKGEIQFLTPAAWRRSVLLRPENQEDTYWPTRLSRTNEGQSFVHRQAGFPLLGLQIFGNRRQALD